jgi:hypothetical protein
MNSTDASAAKKHFGGELPEGFKLAWGGYLAALVEWGLVSADEHLRPCSLVRQTKCEDDPVVAIHLGRPADEESA